MSAVTQLATPAGLDFELPAHLIADGSEAPADAAQDEVRLMVVSRSDERLVHSTFDRLGEHLEPGDLLVVNTSATMPAAVPTDDGRLVHLSTELPGGLWVVELRRPCHGGSLPYLEAEPGQMVGLPDGGVVHLLAPFPADAATGGRGVRLWTAWVGLATGLHEYLARHGHPIRYGCSPRVRPLSDYQTLFTTEAGSAEMPSAARAFTPGLVTTLVTAGVGIAPVLLHTGVSSQETGEPPYPERYRVPLETAERVNAARAHGHRVIAVGTTVTRALETSADALGSAHPGAGWTDLVITPERPPRVVDGLLTGWHEPRTSHLALLEAVAGRALLETSYQAALSGHYRWHEFGDLHLVLP